MKIDAHQHFWNFERIPYHWPTASEAPIYRTIEESELEPDLAACGVEATVLVQAMNAYADTEYMLEVAGRWPRVCGVVGWVPLTKPDEAAAALERFAQDSRFVGVRHLIHEEPDPDWLIRDDVQDGLALLAERGVAFDVVAVLPRHLEHVPVLAERHPELRMVIDHLAKPPIAAGGWQPWADLLAAAGAPRSVHAKVSGLNTAADAKSWTPGDLRPYVEHALSVFGPERLMFGSDWPVALLAGDYGRVWHATRELIGDLAPAERNRILGGTAREFYRIGGASNA